MMNEHNYQRWHQFLLGNMALILVGGLVLLYSASYIYSFEKFGNSFYLIGKQLVALVIGLGAAWVVSKTRFAFWYHNALKIHLFISFLILLCFVPGVGVSINGAHRWINLGFMSIQPGEMLKYSVLINSIYFFENYKNFSKDTQIVYFASLVLPIGLTLFQPDFGTFSICSIIVFFCAFLSNIPRIYFSLAFLVSIAGGFVLMIAAPYRMKRLMSFLDPWADPANSGFQIIQSYLAFANGSIFGRGLGASVEKLFYLPEAYNDFIFSVLAEEAGLVGVGLMALLFLSLLYIGFKIASLSTTRVAQVFVSGAIFLICLQAFLNMGVVLGLLPTKGLNLPFVSYGGTSLVCNLCTIGLVWSMQRYQKKNLEKDFVFKENSHMSKLTRRIA